VAVVYFDLDGTLVRQTRTYDDLRDRAAAAVGGEFPADAHAFQTERFFERFEALADDPYRASFADVAAEYGFDADPGAVRDAYLREEAAGTTTPPGLTEALATLADRHVLGVLSNGYRPAQDRKLAEHDLDERFEATVYAYDVGLFKPDPGIFAAAADRLPDGPDPRAGESPAYVYVGDDAEADVRGAAEAGWSTVQVTDGGPVPEADTAVRPDRFDRLPAAVEGLDP
jgi:putative hydrolase of the HAD superfamily